MADSDATLVARVVTDDDRAAFELLVRRHQSALRNFLRRLAHDDAARADDLAQETFLKAYRSIASFRGGAKFTTWLFQIAYRTFLNDQRKRHPEVELDIEQHSAAAVDTSFDSEEDAIETALASLSLRQRAVFDLHYKKGLTHSELCQALDLPLGTIKSDLTRGRERLRELLKDWQED